MELRQPAGDPAAFDLKPVEKTKSRLNAVVKLAKRKDVTDLVNACDAGREGELIFRLIEQYARRRSRKPWASRPAPVAAVDDPQAIRDGFEKLRSDKQMRAWPMPRARAPRPTGWWASTAPAP